MAVPGELLLESLPCLCQGRGVVNRETPAVVALGVFLLDFRFHRTIPGRKRLQGFIHARLPSVTLFVLVSYTHRTDAPIGVTPTQPLAGAHHWLQDPTHLLASRVTKGLKGAGSSLLVSRASHGNDL